jgi:hypothetical protein
VPAGFAVVSGASVVVASLGPAITIAASIAVPTTPALLRAAIHVVRTALL